jgi:hypothetical protein
MEIKYKTIHNKIRKLSSIPQTNKTPNTYHKRTENLTKFTFTGEEILLLNKGLKYNVHKKQKIGYIP